MTKIAARDAPFRFTLAHRDRIHPAFRPMLDLLSSRRAREAADWIDRFRDEQFGYPQYRDYHAGTVYLVEIPKPIRSRTGRHFADMRLTIAIPTSRIEGDGEAVTAWSPTGDTDLHLEKGYKIVAEAAPRS
jgi:hypothetical protein